MTTLRAAAQQALEFCEFLWREVLLNDWAEGQRQATEAALEAALAEPVQEHDLSRCPKCNGHDREVPPNPYVCTKCMAEPVQEPKPVAWRFEARHIDSAWAAAVTLKHPGPEGIYMRNVMPLYAHPPQRLPLTDEEIVALIHPIVMADMPDEMTDYEIARAIERAIKRAHGIGVQP